MERPIVQILYSFGSHADENSHAILELEGQARLIYSKEPGHRNVYRAEMAGIPKSAYDKFKESIQTKPIPEALVDMVAFYKRCSANEVSRVMKEVGYGQDFASAEHRMVDRLREEYPIDVELEYTNDKSALRHQESSRLRHSNSQEQARLLRAGEFDKAAELLRSSVKTIAAVVTQRDRDLRYRINEDVEYAVSRRQPLNEIIRIGSAHDANLLKHADTLKSRYQEQIEITWRYDYGRLLLPPYDSLVREYILNPYYQPSIEQLLRVIISENLIGALRQDYPGISRPGRIQIVNRMVSSMNEAECRHALCGQVQPRS